MKILIIEDEPLVAKDLLKLIARLEPSAVVLDTLTGVQESIAWLTTNELPDLILSDIQLSDGTSFEIFEKRNISCPIIFTTAYDEYAIRAFKLNSIDYLLKPIDAKELENALKKYKNLSHSSGLADQLKNLLENRGKDHKHYKERFLSVQRNSLIPLSVSQISFFHKDELIYIQTLENERLISEHQTLDEIEELVDPVKFFRVNRQFLVHIQAVAKIKTTHKGLSIQLKPPFNLELDLSREKATAFKNWIG
jgi:Response regulator of the LytR/AlgR family